MLILAKGPEAASAFACHKSPTTSCHEWHDCPRFELLRKRSLITHRQQDCCGPPHERRLQPQATRYSEACPSLKVSHARFPQDQTGNAKRLPRDRPLAGQPDE